MVATSPGRPAGGAVLGRALHDAPGETIEAAAPTQAEALGAVVATVYLAHRAGVERRWTIDAQTLAVRPLARIGPFLTQAGHDVDALVAFGEEMADLV
jgi:hypothetical protein